MEPRRAGSTARGLLASCLFFTVLWSSPGFTNIELHSGPNQVAMLELFTSQGCSSCPPADAWLSDLEGRDGLWTKYVPLAFHVDYWDDIGWKDRFASPAHTLRQRLYDAEGGVEFVYTPGFLVDGQEWRQWRSATEPAHPTVDVGELSVSIESGKTFIQFSPSNSRSGTLVATVATLGFGLESNIGAGENSGRTLKNDFVVLGFNRTSMNEEDGSYTTRLSVPKSDFKTSRRAVVVWISGADSQVPLQATGGWYPDAP